MRRSVAGREGMAYHLTAGVDAIPVAEGAAEGAEVRARIADFAVGGGAKRMRNAVAGCRKSGDLATGVDADAKTPDTEIAFQRPQIDNTIGLCLRACHQEQTGQRQRRRQKTKGEPPCDG